MKVDSLDRMVKGWFVGAFEPAAHHTSAVEVAVRHYKAGDREDRHIHRIAAELTVIVAGEAEMNGTRLHRGDIAVLHPGESADFLAVTDVTTTVVKLPSVPGDKHPV
jgi:hypothetical protein